MLIICNSIKYALSDNRWIVIQLSITFNNTRLNLIQQPNLLQATQIIDWCGADLWISMPSQVITMLDIWKFINS